MQNIDASYAVQRFNEFMDGLAPPRGLVANPEAMQREADALAQIVERHVPRSGASEWIGKVCDWLRENLEYRTWPTGKELATACRECRPDPTQYRDLTGPAERDDAAMYAEMMGKSMSVPVSCIYGSIAAEIEDRGLVSAETMKSYRSRYFFDLKDTYKESGLAEAKEAEMRRRHEDGKDVYRSRMADRRARDISIPNKRTPIPDGWAA